MSITKSLAKIVKNHDVQKALSSRLRAKRISPLLRLIEAVSQEQDCVNIIDIGGTEKYWTIVPNEFLEAHNVNITIVNIPKSHMPEDHDKFRFVEADGCDLSQYADNYFHIAHSNSVVEHVGDWTRMVQFSKELKRVAQGYFVQTPNYWFPIEPHCMTAFFHWLPKPIRIWLVMKISLGHYRKAVSVDDAVRLVEHSRLLNRAMFFELFNDSEVLTERFALMPKSFIAIREQKNRQ